MHVSGHRCHFSLSSPYSSDLNPIEESFAQLKQWIKKNRVLAEQFGDDFAGFLRCGLEAIQLAYKGHFRKCQIGRTEPRNDEDMDSDMDEELDGLNIIN